MFPGIFESEEEFSNLQFVTEGEDGVAAEEKCEVNEDCVAVVKTNNVSTAVLMDYLDIDTFKASEDKVTLLKIINATKDTNVDAANAWDDIDTCCPKHSKTNTNELLKSINLSLIHI